MTVRVFLLTLEPGSKDQCVEAVFSTMELAQAHAQEMDNEGLDPEDIETLVWEEDEDIVGAVMTDDGMYSIEPVDFDP